LIDQHKFSYSDKVAKRFLVQRVEGSKHTSRELPQSSLTRPILSRLARALVSVFLGIRDGFPEKADCEEDDSSDVAAGTEGGDGGGRVGRNCWGVEDDDGEGNGPDPTGQAKGVNGRGRRRGGG
jgi:hypothetical protein